MNASAISRTVAANVRAEAARSGSNIQDLSAAAGVHRVTLGRRLSGQLPFTIDELVAIATYFNVPLDTLLVGIEQTQASA